MKRGPQQQVVAIGYRNTSRLLRNYKISFVSFEMEATLHRAGREWTLQNASCNVLSLFL